LFPFGGMSVADALVAHTKPGNIEIFHQLELSF